MSILIQKDLLARFLSGDWLIDYLFTIVTPEIAARIRVHGEFEMVLDITKMSSP
jgi:hypothetical protein